MTIAAISGETVAWIAVIGTTAGALIGATAGGVVDFVVERRRERRRALIGARLTMLDLTLAASRLKSAEEDGQWWTFYEMPMAAWKTYQDALSARLKPDEFEVVTQAVAELEALGRLIQQAPIPPGARYRDVQSSLPAIHQMRVNATRAHKVLARLAKSPSVTGLLHEGDDPPGSSSPPQ
jgi:hypothetical protein